MRACPLARVWAGVRPGARVWGRRKSPTTEKGLNRCQSSRVSVWGSTVKNGNIGLWRDTNQAGPGLDADTHAKKRGELAGLLRHGHNGGTIADTDNPARLAVQADDIASAETKWRKGFHLEF